MSQFENPGMMHMDIRKWKVQTPFQIFATILSLVVRFLCTVQGLEINMVMHLRRCRCQGFGRGYKTVSC